MYTFATPRPVNLRLDVGCGRVELRAEDRADTVVEVRPADPGNADDVALAERTTVEGDGERVAVTTPHGMMRWLSGPGRGAVDVVIALPFGSSVDAKLGAASLFAGGVLGSCRANTGLGDLVIDTARDVHLSIGVGDLRLRRVTGTAELISGTGEIHVGTLEEAATIKTSSGPTWVGEACADLRVKGASGDIHLGRTIGDVTVKTASGGVRIDDAAGGQVALATAVGDVIVGVADGVAAWLDLQTGYGLVQNELASSAAPADGEARVEVRARTAAGNITVHRSSQAVVA